MERQAEVPRTVGIKHRYEVVNAIHYHYAEAGEGPVIVLLHGFPELWYSWRRQLAALSRAGYHAVAPDLRGFGESEVTDDIEDYSLVNHAKDIRALISHLGVENVVVVGHDWGANLMWIMAMLYPKTVKAVVSLSIPFYPEPRDPAQVRAWSKDKFNFFSRFETKGAVEAEFTPDPDRFFRLLFYGLSGNAPKGTVDKLYLGKKAGENLLDGFPEPDELPAWLGQKDLDYYVSAFRKTGLTPALGFYRNMERDYPLLKEIYEARISQPVLFIGGAEEAAVRFGSMKPMQESLPHLKKIEILEHCGHWVQQERAEEVSKLLIEFLKEEVK